MSWTLTFLICHVVSVHSLPQGNLEDLIHDIFETGNRNPQFQSNSRPTRDEGIITVCVQENGKPGECVPYYLCSANNSIITDGVDELDIRQWRINSSGNPKQVNEEYQCTNYIEICCGNPDILNIPIFPPATPRPTSTSIFLLDGERGIDSGSSEYFKPAISGCGFRNSDGVGFRIKNYIENEAEFGEFPWMVAILTKKNNLFICGGSLIHPKVVMTSAHCVTARSDMPKLKIRAGEWDTQTKQEILPHQDRNVEQIFPHEQYNNGKLYNDIALLILDSPVTYAENIGVVCLPRENEEPPLNVKCYATGWGKDIFGKEEKNPIILKWTSSAIIPRNKCQADIRKTRLGNKFMLHRTFICADGDKGRNTCRGDGGSPLVCPMPGYPDKFMQSGIVTWGIDCGKGNPRVYVHIASLRSWIDDQLHFNNINDMDLYAP